MGNPYGGLTLDGSSFALAPHSAAYDFGTGSFAIDVSFKCGSGVTGTLLDKSSSGVGWKVELVAGGSVQVTLNALQVTTSTTGLDNGEWHDVHMTVDRKTNFLHLFIDGVLIQTVDVSAVVGVNTSVGVTVGSFIGDVSEVRLSRRARNTTTYRRNVRQFVDDAWTVGLWHFNEGRASTHYDMSETRNDFEDSGVVAYAVGAKLASPVTIVREHTWWAIDRSTTLSTYLNAIGAKKYKYRPNDPAPTEWTVGNSPALYITPGALPDLILETSAFHGVIVPLNIGGTIHSGDVSDIEYFWWAVLNAIFSRYKSNNTAGHLNFSHIQSIKSKGPSFDIEVQSDGFFSKFKDIVNIEVRQDLLSASV
jgi:hypothetical protein